MAILQRKLWILFVLWEAAILTGCEEAKLVVNTAKIVSEDDTNQVYPYKVGKPYQVKGVWYYPKVDYQYDETGIASWYGPGFHGGPTASGEQYNENALTAAHKTLPLPTLVRVTNLENGRSIEVRINDRGPFSNNRILDLSRRSAQLLGMEQKGTARVRVQVLEEESRAFALAAGAKPGAEGNQPAPRASPSGTVVAQSLPPPNGRSPNPNNTPGQYGTAQQQPSIIAEPGAYTKQPLPQPDGKVTIQPVHATNIFIQAGSFLQVTNAQNLTQKLGRFGPATIKEAWIGTQRFYRVRVGPVVSVEDADRLLQDIISDGTQDAKIVVD